MNSLRESIPLDGRWTLLESDRDLGIVQACDVLASPAAIPAEVPGNVELDLVRAGRLPEPFFGMNAVELMALETRHWWYATQFAAPLLDGREPYLRFEGLDCFAEVFLNGQLILTSRNALVEHEIGLDGLQSGQNELVVHLSPWADAVADTPVPVGSMASTHTTASIRVRKPAHAFGWDIMPRAVTAGIWRPCSIELRPPVRLDETYLVTISASETRARLLFHYRILGMKSGEHLRIQVEGTCGESRFYEFQPVLFSSSHFHFDLPEPKRWWPKNRGDQNLYSVTVSLWRGDERIDLQTFRHGVRTVELVRTSVTDESGTGEFHFKVNCERIFALGTNWVPLDAFHSRDAERLPAALALLEEVGCNMVRCWGGNVYESDAFFDFCDEHGILVWQDFAMACARYPEDAAFAEEIAAEARKVVRRLRQHPCVALWAGDNECDECYMWSSLGDPNRNRLTREVLPAVLGDEDPWRPYLPSSPYIDSTAFQKGQRFLPEAHLWGPRDSFRSDFYEGALCHFVSEIGYHGSPDVESIRRFITPEKVWPQTNGEWTLHCTSPIPELHLYDYRIPLMSTQIAALFGEVPSEMQDWVQASQFTQAEAMKTFVERFRTGKWRRTGIIWWNLLDGWPQFSDAVVDYYFSQKPAFDFIKRVQTPVSLSILEENGAFQLIACNDLRTDIGLTFRAVGSAGTVYSEGMATAPADSATVIASWAGDASTPDFIGIEFSQNRRDYKNHKLVGAFPISQSWYRDCLESFYAP